VYSPASNLRGTRDVSAALSPLSLSLSLFSRVPLCPLFPALSPSPAGSFRPVHFLLFSRMPPASDSCRSLNASAVSSRESLKYKTFPLFHPLVRPFPPYGRAEQKNSGALTIPDEANEAGLPAQSVKHEFWTAKNQRRPSPSS